MKIIKCAAVFFIALLGYATVLGYLIIGSYFGTTQDANSDLDLFFKVHSNIRALFGPMLLIMSAYSTKLIMEDGVFVVQKGLTPSAAIILFLISLLVFYISSSFFAALLKNYIKAIPQILSLLFALYIPYRMVRKYYSGQISDGSMTGLGFVRSSMNGYTISVLLALLIGIFAFCLAYVDYKTVNFAGNFTSNHNENKSNAIFFSNTSIYLFSAIFEEIFFRGILFAGFRKSFKPFLVVAFTTLGFVFFHIPQDSKYPNFLLAIMLLSLACSFVRIRYRSIYPSIVLHACYNAFVTGFFLFI